MDVGKPTGNVCNVFTENRQKNCVYNSVHKPRKMKEHSCDNCGGKFRTARTLNNHRKHAEGCAPFLHAYFTCMRCGKGCENMKTFRLHARHCRGDKIAYRLPDETRWQTRCAVLEGMIEATLGVIVPSIELNDNGISLGSLRALKAAVIRRVNGEEVNETPIPVEIPQTTITPPESPPQRAPSPVQLSETVETVSPVQ